MAQHHSVRPHLILAAAPLTCCRYPVAAHPHPQAMTQHHFVLLYPSKLQYVNRTSKAVVQVRRWQCLPSPHA